MSTAELREKHSRARKARAASSAAYALGRMHEKQKDFDKALAYYRKAANLAPDNTLIVEKSGILLFQLGRQEEALNLLRSAVETSPGHANLHSLLGFGLHRAQRLKEAEYHSRKALELNPELIQHYDILFQIAAQKKDQQAIDKLFQKALSLESKDHALYWRLANRWLNLLTRQKGSPEPAIFKRTLPLFERAHDLVPKNPTYLLQTAEIAIKYKADALAMALFTKAFEVSEQNGEMEQTIRIGEALARYHDQKERPAKAIAILESTLQKLSTVAKPTLIARQHRWLANLYQRIEKNSEAEQHLRKAIQVNPEEADHQFDLVQFLHETHQKTQAIQILRGLTRKHTDKPGVLFRSALAYRQMDDVEEALSLFQRVERIAQGTNFPLDSNYYYHLGATQDQGGKSSEAEENLRKAIELAPNNHRAMNHLGYMWAVQNVRLPEAEKLLNQALKMQPNNAAYLDSLGWIYFRQNRLEEAETLIRKSLEQYPNDGTILDHLAEILLARGNRAEAISIWQKALKSDSPPFGIAQKIEQAQK